MKFFTTDKITRLPVPNLFARSSIFSPCSTKELQHCVKRADRLELDRKLNIDVEGQYLNMSRDLPLFIFAYQYMINQKVGSLHSFEDFNAYISLEKLKLFTKAKLTRTRDFDVFAESFERLKSVSIVVRKYDDVLYEGGLVSGYESPTTFKGNKCVRIAIPYQLYVFFQYKQRDFKAIDFDKYLELPSETAQKLFIFLRSQRKDYVDFTYSRLEEVCGLTKSTRGNLKAAKKREYIVKALNELKAADIVSEFKFSLETNHYRIVRVGHTYTKISGNGVKIALSIEEIPSNFSNIKKARVEETLAKSDEDDLPF